LYTITFYSFKGGVGRTMALVNVAAELVRRGRRVLVVDFDLEAPGLETYKHLRPAKPHPGIVEYVTQFWQNYQVPDLQEFIYETKPIGKKGGRLLVMPAGRRDNAYRQALVDLDWKRLYGEKDGFLLFEDTKEGWKRELKPDYVLIDSRTGDTDVLGICTRQLPDAVVLMFTPNEQNLVGLKNVCRDIRREETEGLKKTIRLHFVAANVPNLDDEKGLLDRQFQAFRERLPMEPAERIRTIRRYESLDLLDQSVFTLDRPRSRLARSYRRLTLALIETNPADRSGALRFLRRYSRKFLRHASGDVSDELKRKYSTAGPVTYEAEYPYPWLAPDEEDQRLDKIAGHFLDDAEIYVKIAECRMWKGEWERAVALLGHSLRLQDRQPAALFLRALCRKQLADKEGACNDLFTVLGIHGLDSEEVLSTLRELKAIAPTRLAEAADQPALQYPFSGLREACDILAQSDEGLPHAIRLMRQRLDDHPEDDPVVLHWYLIRAGRWREVIESLECKSQEHLGSAELFALAVAYWGETGSLRPDLCRLALEKDSRYSLMPPDLLHGFWYYSNWLLLWGVGKGRDVLPLIDQAKQEVKVGRRRAFSIWRLREVSLDEFLADCEQFRRLIDGQPIRPAFLEPPCSNRKKGGEKNGRGGEQGQR
jgi:MinD-like ATPase involved in chromosome partitioning or flagellar assembly